MMTSDEATKGRSDEGNGSCSIRHSQFAISPSRSAFTLVEMIVVMAVIVILVGLVVPAATTMWNQRKIADAHNAINGILRTTRAKAAQGSLGDAGVLFYLDDRGIQHAVTIARNPIDPDGAQPVGAPPAWQSDPNWRDVFTVVPGRAQSLPAGMRVVPQYALIDPDALPAGVTLQTYEAYNDAELANEDFDDPPSDADQGQRHRNYFAVLFSADGRLMTERNVLVRDARQDNAGAGDAERGDMTGLWVRAAQDSPVTRYYDRKQTGPQAFDNNYTLPDFLVVPGKDSADVAVCVTPVDGLLVYDDALFKEAATPADKRQFLRDQGQPFYVHHMTGAIVKGPTGENPSQ